MSFFKYVNHNVHRWRHIAFRKRSYEHFEISFLEKTFYFAYLLTNRKNLSHSEAKFICRILLCMKWVRQASVATSFLEIKKKHITSFLDTFPGSVTHFKSFEAEVLAP